MYRLLVTIMVISILGLLIEAMLVFKNLKNKLHGYLFLNCMVMIVNNTGYLLELLAKDTNTYVASLQFSYLGRVWITFSLLMLSVEANIPKALTEDEMELSIALSNLLENAIIACEKLPVEQRYIEVKARFKKQLLLEIANSCEESVALDADGHPSTTAAGHGIGTRSVLAFMESTDSDITYHVENGRFTVRAIIAS